MLLGAALCVSCARGEWRRRYGMCVRRWGEAAGGSVDETVGSPVSEKGETLAGGHVAAGVAA